MDKKKILTLAITGLLFFNFTIILVTSTAKADSYTWYLNTPKNGETGVSAEPTLGFEVYGADEPIDIEWRNASDGSTLAYRNDTTNGAHYFSYTDELAYNRTYHWYVRVDDADGWDTSPYWQFTTEEQKPPTISHVEPEDGKTDTDTTVDLIVDSDDPNDADRTDLTTTFYDASDDSVLGSKTGAGEKTYTWSSLAFSTTYEWYAVVSDDHGNSAQTATYSFTTRAEGNPSNPSNFNVTATTSSLDISWDKGTYADYTLIEFHTSSDATWNRADHTNIYNDTGNSFTHDGLDTDTKYFYKFWSYNTTEGRGASGVNKNGTTAAETTDDTTDDVGGGTTGTTTDEVDVPDKTKIGTDIEAGDIFPVTGWQLFTLLGAFFMAAAYMDLYNLRTSQLANISGSLSSKRRFYYYSSIILFLVYIALLGYIPTGGII